MRSRANDLRSARHRTHIGCGQDQKEAVMLICDPRHFAVALLIAMLPMGFASAAGPGGGATSGGIGGGVGAGGTGSAAVGGGAPTGAVGGGSGRVGGGSPGSSNPAGNGSAGTGSPSMNARGLVGSGINATSGVTNPATRGGSIGGLGGTTGVAPPPADLRGGASPAASSPEGSSAADKTVPEAVHGAAEEQMKVSSTGLSRPGPDGSTITVPARPCGLAAHETDGTTTCIGIPVPKRSRR